MRTYLTTLLLTVGILQSYAQRCGGHTYTIRITEQNGRPIKPTAFEIVPLDGISLQAVEKLPYLEKGLVLDSSLAKSLISRETARLKGKSIVTTDSVNTAHDGGVIIKGGAVDARIRFYVTQMNTSPYILKITIDNTVVYLLDTFFGGCKKTSRLLFSSVSRRSSKRAKFPAYKLIEYQYLD